MHVSYMNKIGPKSQCDVVYNKDLPYKQHKIR